MEPWRSASRIDGGRLGRSWSGAVLEAPVLITGLDDVAVVGESVEEGGGQSAMHPTTSMRAKRRVSLPGIFHAP